MSDYDYGAAVFRETEISRLLRATQQMSLIMIDRDPLVPISYEIFVPHLSSLLSFHQIVQEKEN